MNGVRVAEGALDRRAVQVARLEVPAPRRVGRGDAEVGGRDEPEAPVVVRASRAARPAARRRPRPRPAGRAPARCRRRCRWCSGRTPSGPSPRTGCPSGSSQPRVAITCPMTSSPSTATRDRCGRKPASSRSSSTSRRLDDVVRRAPEGRLVQPADRRVVARPLAADDHRSRTTAVPVRRSCRPRPSASTSSAGTSRHSSAVRTTARHSASRSPCRGCARRIPSRRMPGV